MVIEEKKSYFEGLNTLKFFTALLVLLDHARQNLAQYKIYDYSQFTIFHKGKFGVNFFFVLSGFLLTYLAIQEHKKFGNIDIKNFYLRRIFRIFPLYYMSVFLGYMTLAVIYPLIKGQTYLSFSIQEGLIYHLLLLPNYVIVLYPIESIGALYSLWSIGVEEQFYLIFPVFMYFCLKSRHIVRYLMVAAVCVFLLYHLIIHTDILTTNIIVKRFVWTLRFYMMLIGGSWAAVLFFYKDKIKKIIENKIFQISVWILLFYLIFYPTDEVFNAAHSVFLGLVLIIISQKKTIINVEKKPFIYLGTISFGIYIYHPYVSYFLRFVMEKSSFIMHSIVLFPFLYYIAELLLTIFIAHFSYKYYELYFLKLKSRYMRKKLS